MPQFDIFRGHFGGKDAEWIESVEGLAAANERMKQIAAEKPDAYFVFSPLSRAALAIIDTTYLVRPINPREDEGVA
jgi:hypothetical protein